MSDFVFIKHYACFKHLVGYFKSVFRFPGLKTAPAVKNIPIMITNGSLKFIRLLRVVFSSQQLRK